MRILYFPNKFPNPKICIYHFFVVILQRKIETQVVMKARMLSGINAFITFVIGLLGFGMTGCVYKYGSPEPPIIAEYGCPYATLEVKGKVTDEASQPIENIRVVTHSRYTDDGVETYTDENGNYQFDQSSVFPVDSVDIIATDTAGIYAPDSVRVGVTYDRTGVSEEDHWNEGEGSVYHDFQLKKK